jgi:hypothetical protein
MIECVRAVLVTPADEAEPAAVTEGSQFLTLCDARNSDPDESTMDFPRLVGGSPTDHPRPT